MEPRPGRSLPFRGRRAQGRVHPPGQVRHAFRVPPAGAGRTRERHRGGDGQRHAESRARQVEPADAPARGTLRPRHGPAEADAARRLERGERPSAGGGERDRAGRLARDRRSLLQGVRPRDDRRRAGRHGLDGRGGRPSEHPRRSGGESQGAGAAAGPSLRRAALPEVPLPHHPERRGRERGLGAPRVQRGWEWTARRG